MKSVLRILMVMIVMLSLQSFKSNIVGSNLTVYICATGKVYHSTNSCRGLANATHKIKAVPLSEAKKTRRACKICY